MKIGILGTRGIPNNHGGFEQFAEFFSVYLAEKGHEVSVYNSHNHPFKEKSFKNVKIIHCYDPEYKIGTIGQFVYDLNCIVNSRKQEFELILQLGYTSSTIWHMFLPKSSIIVTNMDGLEWKRTKYRKIVRKFLKYAEKLGTKHSDYLIADSLGIQEYLKRQYNKGSKYLAYGAEVFQDPNPAVLNKFKLKKYSFALIIARLEPENNIETILEGFHRSNAKYPILLFGKENRFGLNLKKKYILDNRIQFVGANYNIIELNNLRYFSRYYFHGHTVGGTNPSLLEAMSSKALIIAHDNIFNKSILQKNALYFTSSKIIQDILNSDSYFSKKEEYSSNNIESIKKNYSWEFINKEYEKYLLTLVKP